MPKLSSRSNLNKTSSFLTFITRTVAMFLSVVINNFAWSETQFSEKGSAYLSSEIVKSNVINDNHMNNLRCWQEGLLIFEEQNIEIDRSISSKTGFAFSPSSSSQKHNIHLLQVGDATCMYKVAENAKTR